MLLETIRCEAGTALHLSYHQQRLDETLRALEVIGTYDLKTLVIPPETGTYRCRFLYDAQGYVLEFHPYSPRTFASLRLVYDDALDYPLKYADRDELNILFDRREECDDVLIVKNGFLCDTTIANIALRIGGKWLTPEKPLLAGTTRARLINEGFLHPAALTVDDIAKASKVAVMNAMMGFVEVENGIIG